MVESLALINTLTKSTKFALKYNFIIYFYTKEINQVLDIKGQLPAARAFHGSVLVEGRDANIIIYGGILQNNRVSNEIFIYNLKNREFTQFLTGDNNQKSNNKQKFINYDF